jgi:serine/threonine-protein kinase HipA
MQPGLQPAPHGLRHGLHGVFDDSLPDGWGLLLMDRVFLARGVRPGELSALDRLAYLGRRTLGALTYHPCSEPDTGAPEAVRLGELASAALAVHEGGATEVLPALQRAGGSPGGARPKVLVGLLGDRFISGADDLPPGYRPWLIKFNTRDDGADAGALEYVYARMARAAGITAPEARLFDLPNGERCFGVRRFDRDDDGRVHMHTLANLLHVDYRTPSLDYEHLIRVTTQLTRNHSHVRECFRRALFNWLAHNRDDHGKNFAFLMRRDGTWDLSPAYDLTFAEGAGGEHTTTYAGQGKRPRWTDLQRLARLASIDAADALQILAQVREGVATWASEAAALQVPSAQVREIAGRLAEVEAAGELPPRTPAPRSPGRRARP